MDKCSKCHREHAGECDPKDIAGLWLSGYFISQDDISDRCDSLVYEVEHDDKWNERCEFVAECLAAGIKPVHYAECLLDHAREFIDSAIVGCPPIAVLVTGRPASGKTSWIQKAGFGERVIQFDSIKTMAGLQSLKNKSTWPIVAVDPGMCRDTREIENMLKLVGYLVTVMDMDNPPY
jgi:hypothetical protein